MTEIEPWQERLAEEPEEARENTLLSRIPLLAGDDKKMDYLSWRATGFPVRQACDLAGVSQATVNRWRRHDVEFAAFESDRLPELQRLVGKDVLRLEFMRNFRLLLKQDADVIWKALKREEMTDKEWSYYRQIRKHYTPGEFLNLEKALTPEKHRQGPMVVKLSFGSGNSPELIEAEEGSYRELNEN